MPTYLQEQNNEHFIIGLYTYICIIYAHTYICCVYNIICRYTHMHMHIYADNNEMLLILSLYVGGS